MFQVVDGHLFVAVPVVAGLSVAVVAGIFGAPVFTEFIEDITHWPPFKRIVVGLASAALIGGLIATAAEKTAEITIGAILNSARRDS
jgi:phosphate/sulfate permease